VAGVPGPAHGGPRVRAQARGEGVRWRSAGAQPVGRALSGWERGPPEAGVPLSQPDSAQPGGLGLCQAEAMASLGLRLGCAWWL
jgi:hypothetical protein